MSTDLELWTLALQILNGSRESFNVGNKDPFLMEKLATVYDREVMRHALGLNNAAKSYRNRFLSDPSGADFDVWQRLVILGLAVNHGPTEITGGLVFFSVTDAGREIAERP